MRTGWRRWGTGPSTALDDPGTSVSAPLPPHQAAPGSLATRTPPFNCDSATRPALTRGFTAANCSEEPRPATSSSAQASHGTGVLMYAQLHAAHGIYLHGCRRRISLCSFTAGTQNSAQTESALNNRVTEEGNSKERRCGHYPESLIGNVCSRRWNGQ